jgi:hypothetical protein
MLDVECDFFVDTFDLCPKTHGLIIYNFMFEFDCTVTSVGSLSRAFGRIPFQRYITVLNNSKAEIGIFG